MDNLYTTGQASAMLGITPAAVLVAAKKMGVGTRLGDQPSGKQESRPLMFSNADLEALRNRRRPGPPRKHPQK